MGDNLEERRSQKNASFFTEPGRKARNTTAEKDLGNMVESESARKQNRSNLNRSVEASHRGSEKLRVNKKFQDDSDIPNIQLRQSKSIVNGASSAQQSERSHSVFEWVSQGADVDQVQFNDRDLRRSKARSMNRLRIAGTN